MSESSNSLDILTFWAILFLTSIIGLVEFLPELENWKKYQNKTRLIYQVSVSLLYFGLLILGLLSFFKFVKFYELGFYGSPTLESIEKVLSLSFFSLCMRGIIFLIFTSLYIFKTGLIEDIKRFFSCTNKGLANVERTGNNDCENKDNLEPIPGENVGLKRSNRWEILFGLSSGLYGNWIIDISGKTNNYIFFVGALITLIVSGYESTRGIIDFPRRLLFHLSAILHVLILYYLKLNFQSYLLGICLFTFFHYTARSLARS